MPPSKSFEMGSGRYRGKTIRFRKNHFIVKFKQYDGNSDDARQILKSVIGHSNFQIVEEPIGNWNYFWVGLDDNRLLAMVEKLDTQFRNEVEFAEPALTMVSTIIPNDKIFDPVPPFPYPEWNPIPFPPWAFKTINIFKAWDIQTGTHDVIIGLLDSGLPLEPESNPTFNLHDSLGSHLIHEDLDGDRFIAGMDYVNNQPWPNDSYFFHGINMAGILASTAKNTSGMAGVNWGSSVYVYKSLQKSSDQANTPQTAYSLRSDAALVHMGIRDTLNFAAQPLTSSPPGKRKRVVFNLCHQIENDSIPPQDYPQGTLEEIFKLVNQEDAIICISAGNGGGDVVDPGLTGANGEFPGNVIVVGGINDDDTLWLGSCIGLEEMVFAPGDFMPTTDKGSDGYDLRDGTSMATPHVAALAALMWSEAPHLPAPEIVEILKATCRQPGYAQKQTFKDAAGNISPGRGIIDAYAALCELKTRICLVLDRSESMDKPTGIDGLTRLDILKIVAGDLIELVEIGSSLGIISFNENHDEVVPLSLVENPVTTPNVYLGIEVVPDRRVTWRNRVNFLKAEGFTSIGNGVIAARTMLGQLGPPGQPGQPAQPGQPSQPSQPAQPAQPDQPGQPGHHNQRKAIIVLTDGEENRGTYLEDLPILPDDIPVFGLGWGSPGNIQPAGLLSLAENTGGYLVMADQFDQDWFQTISKYLTQIVGEISGYETVLDPAGKIKAGEPDKFDFLLGDTDTSAEVIIIKPADKPLELQVFSPDNKLWKNLRTWTSSSGRVMRSRFSLPGDYLAESRNYYGKWKAEVSLPEGSPEDDEVPYTLLVQARSTLKMKCRIRQSALAPGSTLGLQIDLTEGGTRLGPPAKMSVQVIDPAGKQHDVEPDQRETGGLYYSFITHDQGIYQWQVKASSEPNGGRQFQRECFLTGAVWPQKVSDTPGPDPRPDPDLNDGVEKGG